MRPYSSIIHLGTPVACFLLGLTRVPYRVLAGSPWGVASYGLATTPPPSSYLGACAGTLLARKFKPWHLVAAELAVLAAKGSPIVPGTWRQLERLWTRCDCPPHAYDDPASHRLGLR